MSVTIIFTLCFLYGANGSAYEGRSDDNVLKNILNSVESLEALVNKQSREIDELQNMVNEQKITMTSQDKHLKKQGMELQTLKALATSEAKVTYTEYGCRQDVLALSCIGGKNISIMGAYFGMYNDIGCIDTCCNPDPSADCMESAQENLPIYWDALLDSCQNKPSCEFVVPAANVESCPEPSTSNFLSVDFQCLPEDTTNAVGFTATTLLDRLYSEGNVMLFEIVETNLGGYFDVESGIFTCPVNGIYAFALSVTAYYNYGAICNIAQNGKLLPGAVSGNDFFQGTSFAVVNCTTGDRVWAETYAGSDYIDGEEHKPTSFSGFLINAF